MTVGSLSLEQIQIDGKTKEQWVVSAQPHVRVRLKNVFGGAAKHQLEKVCLSHTDEVCRDLTWFLERYPMDLSLDDRAVLQAGCERQLQRVETITRILEGDFQLPAVTMALRARPYQEQAAAAVLNTGRLLLIDELGLGKTVSAIRVIADARALPALCVVHTSLTHQWAHDEIAKFLPGLRVHIINSGSPYDLRERCKGQEPHVVVITYGKLAGWKEHFEGKFRFIVFDEIQELRTGHDDAWTSSKKNVAAAHVSWSTPMRMGLSATPIYNYGGELWNVLDVLAPGALGTRVEFLREWCLGSDKRKAQVIDPDALGSHLLSSGLMMRRTRDDVGRQLPPVNRIVHEVSCGYESEFWDSDGAAAELARIVLDELSKNLEKGRAARLLDGMLRQATGVAKAPFVAAFVRLLLEQETDKIVLFGWHREVYQIWAELLEDVGLAWHTGSESPAKKRKEVARFIEGDARVMVMSLRSGIGLNRLQDVSATAVFGELDWSYGVHEQCTGRLHRDGQTRPVFAYYVVGDSGSDPVVIDVLGIKNAQLTGIRDPGGAAVVSRTVDPDHVKKLARDYLRRFGTNRS